MNKNIQKFFDIPIDKNALISSVTFEICESIEDKRIFRNVMNKHHSYMKYKDTCNRRINWLVYESESGNLIGALGINSAILAINPRDKFIGWNKTTRLKNLNKIANNYRFCLIKNNITIDNAGSIVLRSLRKYSRIEWKKKYGDELVLLETLVKNQWSGSVYLADNWKYVGMTKGFSFSKAPLKLWQQENSERGRLARENPKEAIERYAVGRKQYDIKESDPKKIFVIPLIKNWKEILVK